jgi:DNA-binding SARP family transcriptional activator/tetratricopeptide (TPR) repeat protein
MYGGGLSPTRLRLSLLGGLKVELPSGIAIPLPAGKIQALLAYLASRPGQAHPRDKLAALLWDDAPASRARHRLRQALHELRRALPALPGPLFLDDGDALAVDPASVDVDVPTFESAAAEGSPAALDRAAALYRGDLLEGLRAQTSPFEEWLLAERERLRELALEVLGRLLAHQVRTGADAAPHTAARLLGLDPLQEAVHRTLMRLHAQRGRRGAALRHYETCVNVLRRELGVDPEPETRQLYLEILQTPGAPAPAFELPRPGLPDAPPERETPLIGREAELGRLRQARETAWQGHGRVAMVLGEAGIGKTRLLEEFLAEAACRGSRVVVGRAYESEAILPFGLWVEAFRTARLLPAIEASLGSAQRAELTRLFPELEGRGSSTAPARGGDVRLFEAMTQMVVEAAADGPLLLALEDLQWADELSLRLLAYLARRLSRCPVLVVGTAREDELAEAPVLRQLLGELDGERPFLRVHLAGLSRADTFALVQVVARTGMDATALPRLAETVWRASEGNPFMMVETLRSLEDSPAAASSGPSLPQRVRDTVTRRLERLSERARRLVTVAAATGREFEFTVVQRAAGLTPVEAAEGIEELVGRRIVHVLDERLDFTHEWIRMVAYDRLLPPARPAVHAAVGQVLEAFYAGRLHEAYDRLAYQYARTADVARAIEYLACFAEQAARGYAHGDAVRALADAAARVDGLPAGNRDGRYVDLCLRQAHSLHLLGRLRDVLDVLLPARDRVERLADSPLSGQYFLRLGHTYSVLGDRQQAAGFIGLAIDAATRCGDTATLGKAHYVAAVERVYGGRPAEGAEHGRQAVRLLTGAGEPWWLGLGYWITGLSELWLGELDAALESEAHAFRLGIEIDDSRVRAFAAWTTGLVHGARGDWDVALDSCRMAREISRDPVNTAMVDGFSGSIHVERGDPASARPLLATAIEQFWKFDYRQAVAQFTAALADAHRLAGDLDSARRLASDALTLGRETGFPLAVGWAQRALGRIAMATGDHAVAAAELTAALETSLAMGAGLEVARSQLALAELAQARQDSAGAAEPLRDAHQRFTAMGARRHVARVEVLAAALNVIAGGSAT